MISKPNRDREQHTFRNYLKKYLAEHSISILALSELSEFEPKYREELQVAHLVSRLKKINKGDDDAEIAKKNSYNKKVINKQRNIAKRSIAEPDRDVGNDSLLNVNTLRGLFNSEKQFTPNAKNIELLIWMFESEIAEYNDDLFSNLNYSEQEAVVKNGQKSSNGNIVECEVIGCSNTLTVTICPSMHVKKCFEKFVVVNQPVPQDGITICRSCLNKNLPFFKDDYAPLVKKIESYLEQNVPGVGHNFLLNYLNTSKSTLFRLRHEESYRHTYINKELAIKIHRLLLSADSGLLRFHFLSLYHDFLYGKATIQTERKLLFSFFDIGNFAPKITNSFTPGDPYEPEMKVTHYMHQTLISASSEMMGRVKWAGKLALRNKESFDYEIHPDIVDYKFGGVACIIGSELRFSMTIRILIDLNVVLTEQVMDKNEDMIAYKYVDKERRKLLIQRSIDFDDDETQITEDQLKVLENMSWSESPVEATL